MIEKRFRGVILVDIWEETEEKATEKMREIILEIPNGMFGELNEWTNKIS